MEFGFSVIGSKWGGKIIVQFGDFLKLLKLGLQRDYTNLRVLNETKSPKRLNLHKLKL